MAALGLDNPRRIAYDILLRVEDGAFSDMALDSALKRTFLDPRDKRLTTELVYGVLRLRGRVDFALSQFCDRPLHKLEDEVLWLLRLGAYQLLELERVPAHAAVDSSVSMAREVTHDHKSAGFINAVLRSLERGKEDIPWPEPAKIKPYLQHVCSMPAWLTKEIMRLLPNDDARALGESLATAPPLSLRVNSLKTDRPQYMAELEAAGYQVHSGSYVPEAVIVDKRGESLFPGDGAGLYQIQDEASMLMAHLLDVKAGQKILDACAAPGGKTTHIAALTENKAEIVALDKYHQRVDLIEKGAKRLGCTEISAQQWNLNVFPEFLGKESFDRILLDAPCSGLGVIRRNPEGRWNKDRGNLRTLASLQGRILRNVAGLLKPGGKLLYSVCTFSHQETDAIINDFLETHPKFELDLMKDEAPKEWSDLFTDQGTLRSFPHRHGGMDSFFAARIKRKV